MIAAGRVSVGITAVNKTILLAAGLSVLMAAPAFAARTCLQYGSLYNFDAQDDKTLIVEDNFHNKFKISLMGICPQLTFKFGIGFRSFGPHMALDCVSSGDDIVTRNAGTGGQRCPIRSVVAYTPDMAKADADAAAAKKANPPSP
jgi:hypothetical protein